MGTYLADQVSHIGASPTTYVAVAVAVVGLLALGAVAGWKSCELALQQRRQDESDAVIAAEVAARFAPPHVGKHHKPEQVDPPLDDRLGCDLVVIDLDQTRDLTSQRRYQQLLDRTGWAEVDTPWCT